MIDFTVHPIQEITPALLADLARLHHAEDTGLLSDFGYEVVLRYYEGVLKDERVIGFYALSNEGKLIGYNIGSPDPAALTSRLTENKPWFVRQILRMMFMHPISFLQLIISSITVKNQMQGETESIESIYLTVDPTLRGRGIGRRIEQVFMQACREAGYKYIVGSIQTYNVSSVAMTTANGFKIEKTFREGFYKRYRIRLTL
jgi:GNAT superfamily N-acetyltransferase